MGWSRATVRVGPAINRVKDPMTKPGRNEVVPFLVICIGGAMPTRSPLPLGTIEGYVMIRDFQVLKPCVFLGCFICICEATTFSNTGVRASQFQGLTERIPSYTMISRVPEAEVHALNGSCAAGSDRGLGPPIPSPSSLTDAQLTPPGLAVWATLITKSTYLPGLLTLAYSLRKSNSAYPLLALYTDSLPPPCLAANGRRHGSTSWTGAFSTRLTLTWSRCGPREERR